MKKYDKILRYGKMGTHRVLDADTNIAVWEKLDGANASFKLSDNIVQAFSRNRQLDEEETLRGFFEYVNTKVPNDKLTEGFVYFGEWLVPHTVKYNETAYYNFYLFDIWDGTLEEYLDYDLVKSEAEKLGLTMAPLFYHGPSLPIETIKKEYVGKSHFGDVGEGVVIKADNYFTPKGEQLYVKVVSDEFAEKAKTKKHSVNSNVVPYQMIAEQYVTEARAEKLVNKLVDEGIINEDYDLNDMGTILKNSASRMVEDIIEEEINEIIGNIKKRIGKVYPHVVRSVVERKMMGE